MPEAKFTLYHSEVQQIVASHLENETGFKVMAEEVAFFDQGTDNPHGAQEIEISASATAR